MRLSDEKIDEFSASSSFTSFGDSKRGMEYARDFYEGQKCNTCSKNKFPPRDCPIHLSRMALNISDNDFGCTAWTSI